jgi:hypothetical protein
MDPKLGSRRTIGWETKHFDRGQYSCLYNIARTEVLSSSPPNLSWCKDLIGAKLVAWNALPACISNIVLTHEQDELRWNLTKNEQFLVKSHYLAMIHCVVSNINKRLWKLRAPLKIKIFFWHLR